MTAAGVRALLAADHVTHVPGVHDPATAALAVRAGHRAVHLAGAAIAATMLSRAVPPGAAGTAVPPGTARTATPPTARAAAPGPAEFADRAAVLAPAVGGVPLLADADAGFGTPDHAVWTALAYHRAGVGGIVLGDGGNATPAVLRIRALATRAPEVAVVAEATGDDLATTIERCRLYARAGADAVLVSGVRPGELGRLRAGLPGVPLVLSRAETGAGEPWPGDAELARLGVRLVLHPLAAVLAALRAASLAYRAILEEGTADRVDRLPPAALAALIDRPEDHGGPGFRRLDT
ncbi:hypothetical protein Asp14428_00630 [Actinoplanes sp. NBRC 14428]|uniref:Methylisocitrate lyase n=1 Tax=Pseudosporangium ferrugineum TaxID=439699 RepID=A0A2T0SJ62_9ACTN|nr:isocitrate lyase/phosphoenolpyruvate mutase family protein [Pseudosporangium ferrugineum]PRY33413.1 methylisocitrate lyase [Pseudosporangium ferrugineum]BCJ48588.1 hypothetical protein Asp14428_00630 [Actinoplanes sp. NBRC 14428]